MHVAEGFKSYKLSMFAWYSNPRGAPAPPTSPLVTPMADDKNYLKKGNGSFTLGQKTAPDVGVDVVTTASNSVADTVDTTQDRSSRNCDTPLVTRLDSKLLAFMCKAHVSDQMSVATQLGFDKHKSMQAATDDNG